ncbi:ATP-binding cassette domain-containing protein [Lactobacillus sp. B4007]|uniref:ATP-binding cassette domain-containing protein n=1 Tax=Lactobacillus sp. B4007 TaxID=2818032 RepID=UPI0022697EAF|nr:ABC transporter ATP-binding protein [Lactobacillus sp. B4007]MCX8724677.1 ABC transporter ATP-binding protein [Lactobacillus sp. B4007]
MSIKELFKSNIPRGMFILLAYVLYAIAETLNNYLIKFATDNLTKKAWTSAVMWLVIIAIMGLFTFFLLPLGTYLFNQQIQNYLHQIRTHMMKHYYGQKSVNVAEMANQLGNNLKILTDNYAKPWIDIWSTILRVILAITAILTMHWSIVIATILITIIVLLLPKILEKRLARASAIVAKANSTFLNTISNWFSGLGELRRYQSKKTLKQAIKQKSQALADANITQGKISGEAQIINGIGNSVGQVGICFWCSILYFSQQITIGDWLTSLGFVSIIFNGLWQVITAITKIKSTVELREQVATLVQPVKITNKRVIVDAVQSHNLVVTYANGEKLTYPDFEIKPGEKVLLTGDSGTGKSTLFKVLLNQIKPSAGSVMFKATNEQLIKPQNAQVGYIAQDASLFPTTIANNITMFNQQLNGKLKQVLQKVQLAPDLAKFPAQTNTVIDLDQPNLSGGQRQKVVLARAEIHETKFLLLDEATSAIDRQGTKQIISELLKTNATILMIAHNFSPELIAQFDRQIHLTTNSKGANNNDD